MIQHHIDKTLTSLDAHMAALDGISEAIEDTLKALDTLKAGFLGDTP